MESLLAKKKVFKANITHAEKAVSKVKRGEKCAIAVHMQRIEFMMAETDKLLANICMEAKNEEEYNTNEEELGDAQERLTALMIRLAENGVILPKLQLPVFSGNLQRWISSKDPFEAADHQNYNFTGAQKDYKGLLHNEAVSLIKSVPVNSANYIEAWTNLNARYEKKSELIDSTLKQLFSQPAVNMNMFECCGD
ncbi:hypothetical protein PR048_013859 [Dryococelus australis]|uniref:Uncharacterized protein n=1 Tax=Dryococelus australis TaxID=614101 RepID=A0ABQ9HTD4_9NEOP|nr:hypothetical protein PR048_013859 [Dryococelus australis]